jgi:mono/diheme cytochrome c family protein
VALVSAMWLAGCAMEVEIKNQQAVQEIARLTKPPGSIYTGWRVFHDKCSSCHSPAATGTEGAPDLLPKVREMGPRQFVSLVLMRYNWNIPPAQLHSTGAEREALVEELVQRKKFMLTMPAWQGEPLVNAHIVDLYAYLTARAEGKQGPDRPRR